MFKFSNLKTDLEDVKFDAVAQALASSQTLISSFRTVVTNIVSKVINSDSLIKGQNNGPDLMEVTISDSVNQLKRIKEDYQNNMDLLTKHKAVAFTDNIDDSEINAILMGSSSATTRMDISSFRPNINLTITKFDTSLNGTPVDFILSFESFPKFRFFPNIANTQSPALSAMVNTNFMLTSHTSNIPLDFWSLNTLPTSNRPCWIATLPLLISSDTQSGSDPDYGIIQKSKYTFENDGHKWYVNAYLIQVLEYQATGSSTWFTVACDGIFVTASYVQNGSTHTRCWLKYAEHDTGYSSSDGEGKRFNKTWQWIGELNYLQFNEIFSDKPMMVYDEGNDCFKPYDYPNLVGAFLENYRNKQGGAFNYQDYVRHVGNYIQPSDYSIGSVNVNSKELTTVKVVTDNIITFTNLRATIPEIVGDVTSSMESVISDLSNPVYE